jgi:hypothetical protein
VLELAQQLSYHLSVIDNGATAQLVSYGQQLSALSNIASAARATLDTVISPLMQVGNAWGQREQQINNIARTLRQYQYVGQSISDINRKITEGMPGIDAAARGMQFGKIYGEQFQQARSVTRDILHEMNRIAALLPGETSDYIQAFNQSLPFLSQARGMNLGRAVQMTSYLTAGGIAGGIDAGQTSRDLMQFLTMGPHMMDRSWTEVWSQYATLHGRRVTAEQIRGMDINKKVQVLSEIMDQLKPMMGAMGDSFEATVGTFNSLKHELYLTATEPIFESFKGIIAAVNSQLSRFAPYVGIVANYFAGLPNRLEEIANKNGVRYINDTTSTTPDATIAALEAFASSPIHLIFGGADKELEFEEVVSVIKRVKPRIYLLPGTAHEKIKKVFTRAKISWIEVSDLAEVFAHLKHQTKKGDIVLLSPGCASFGLFKNEFDRGDTFRRLVHSL